MAQRFGGKYSPGGKSDSAPPERGRVEAPPPGIKAGIGVNLLFIAPLPLVLWMFGNGPTVLALNLWAMALLILGAWLTREGIVAQKAFDARKIARRPKLPRKICGSVLTGLGLGFAAYSGSTLPEAPSLGLSGALIIPVVGAALHAFAFGIDPMRDKGMEGVDMFQTDRVARAVEQAETHLAGMRDAIKRAGDAKAEARVDRFQESVREMLRTVENDPRDLTAARKYLGIYLKGARDATVKFADIFARDRDAGARSDYMMLLTDLEENFVAKTRKLLEDDQTDLEIEIEVLRERLQREGIRPDQKS